MLKKLLLFVFSILVTLFFAEFVFRIYYVTMDKNNYEELLTRLDAGTQRKDVYRWGLDVITRSEFEYCLYENRPNFSGKIDFWNCSISNIQEVKHNADGLRAERDYPIEKDKSIFKRVAVFGDSGMYGWGLSDDETYSGILERLLNDRYQGRYKFEVINFGVAGYQAIQTMEMFFYKAQKYKPDVVITGTYGLVDLDFGDYFYPKFSFYQKTSFLLFHFSKYFKRDYYDSVLREFSKKAGIISTSGNDLEGSLTRYPQYEKMLGLENARKHMLKLKRYTQENNIYLLDVFLHFGNNWARTGRLGGFETPDKTVTDPAERIKRTKEIGIKTIDAFLLAENYLKEKYPAENIDVFETSIFSVNKTDCHPNGMANFLLAEATVKEMIKDGIIPED